MTPDEKLEAMMVENIRVKALLRRAYHVLCERREYDVETPDVEESVRVKGENALMAEIKKELK